MPKTGRISGKTAAMAKKQKTRLCIVFGGRSGEHEVSLTSAASVINALDPEEFEITAIGITKEGKLANSEEIRRMLPPQLLNRVHPGRVIKASNLELQAISKASKEQGNSRKRPPIFFPLLHGPYGEDGTIQGLFEMAGLPYVGCGVLASAVGMDKDIMKRLFMQAGLPVVAFRAVFARELQKSLGILKKSLSRELGYPMFSKPANLGSSVGVCKIHNEREFEGALRHSAQFDRKILIERGIEGRELECAILGNDDAQASVVGEVIPAHEYYDYDAKYMSPDSRLEIPARINAVKSEQIRNLALRCFRSIDGSGMARVDFFLERKTGKVWVNEINTIPGFTPISMYAKLWAASGVSFEELVRHLVYFGKERFQRKSKQQISAG
jgi:D-alanine-D-alanine ligase